MSNYLIKCDNCESMEEENIITKVGNTFLCSRCAEEHASKYKEWQNDLENKEFENEEIN